MTESKVSVVIPVYNRAYLIGDTIESVLEQTYDNFEVLVVDDGSTDDTASVVKSYGEKVRYIYQDNMGMGGSYARNHGIDASTGEFIAFLDSDDEWLPTKLSRQMEMMDNESDLAWVYCDSEAIDATTENTIFRRSKVLGAPAGDILVVLFQRQFLATPTIIARREIFEELGGFWPTPKATDWDMWLRIASLYPIGYTPEVLVRYRIHPIRVTDELTGEESYEAGLAVINRALERDPERLLPYKNQAIAQLNLTTGMFLTSHGELRLARKYYRQAIDLTPTNLKAYLFFFISFLSKDAFDRLNKLRWKVRKLRSV